MALLTTIENLKPFIYRIEILLKYCSLLLCRTLHILTGFYLTGPSHSFPSENEVKPPRGAYEEKRVINVSLSIYFVGKERDKFIAVTGD